MRGTRKRAWREAQAQAPTAPTTANERPTTTTRRNASMVIVDTYYDAALSALYAKHPGLELQSFDEQRRTILHESFGTADFVSGSLGRLGWEVQDVIANCQAMQDAWARENGARGHAEQVALAQIDHWDPGVVFLQDLSYFTLATMRHLKRTRIVVAQLSSAWRGDERAAACHAVFTSCPPLMEPIRRSGADAIFLPLAFEPRVLQRITIPVARELPVTFVGGSGATWRPVFDELAAAGTGFAVWGYGRPARRVRAVHRGEAWGLDMYSIYARSRIAVNRHASWSGLSGNNLRQYETTGCGAMLLTDEPGEFTDGIEAVSYASGADLAAKARHYLANEQERSAIAAAGQARTLGRYTYDQRATEIVAALAKYGAP